MEIIEEDGIKYDFYKYSDREIWRCRERGSFRMGKLSRINGPAVINIDGRKEYWLNGVCYPEITSDEEWIVFNIIT